MQTAQDPLPVCLIYQVAIESFDKLHLSYFVARAWVDDPNEAPTEMLLMMCPTRSAQICSRMSPIHRASGWMTVRVTSAYAPSTCRACLLRYPVLFHVDALTFYPPQEAKEALRRVGGGNNEDGTPPPEDMPHP